jgi:hypothetical protein
MVLSHLTSRFWCTTVESDETLDAIEDLLTLDSNNFWVSKSVFDDLDLML